MYTHNGDYSDGDNSVKKKKKKKKKKEITRKKLVIERKKIRSPSSPIAVGAKYNRSNYNVCCTPPAIRRGHTL